jgi:hypothetical protein
MTQPATIQPAQIIVTRIDRRWQAEVTDLDLAYEVRALFQLDRWVRYRFGPGWINYRFRTGDPHLDRLVTAAREKRRAARHIDERVRRLTLQVLAATAGDRFSGRDLAVLLGMSHQRVQQLQRERRD